MKITAEDVLAIRHREASGFPDRRRWSASGVSTDSRIPAAGGLFIALRGARFDGHNFLTAAVQAGASGLVVDQRWADANRPMIASLPVPVLVVEDSTTAYGELARIYRSKFDIPVIAIGGSNGKTTTKDMVRDVLATKFRVLSTEGNLNNQIGVPQTLLRLDRTHEVAVVEMGTNHPGEIAALCAIARPTHGLLTNIGREHLEFFGSIDGVARAEGELFEWLAGNRGTVFVNTDDPRLVRLSRRSYRRITYGTRSRSARVRGSRIRLDGEGRAELRVSRAGRSFDVRLSVPGLHNALNAVAAAAVGLTMNVPQTKVAAVLARFSAPSKRMQVAHAGGVVILNDTYNANPDSVLAGLSTMAGMAAAGKRVAILADMLELGAGSEEAHASVGRALRKFNATQLLAFGPLSRSTVASAGPVQADHFADKDSLIRRALELLAPGDVVLVKGSRGMHMEEVVAALTDKFITGR